MLKTQLIDADTMDILADGGWRMDAILRRVAQGVCAGDEQTVEDVRGELAVWVCRQTNWVAALEDRAALFREAKNIRRKLGRQETGRKKAKRPRDAASRLHTTTTEDGQYVTVDRLANQPADLIELRCDTGDLTEMVREKLKLHAPSLLPVFETDLRLQSGGELAPATEVARVLHELGIATTEKDVRRVRHRYRRRVHEVRVQLLDRRLVLFGRNPSQTTASAYLASTAAYGSRRCQVLAMAAISIFWTGSCFHGHRRFVLTPEDVDFMHAHAAIALRALARATWDDDLVYSAFALSSQWRASAGLASWSEALDASVFAAEAMTVGEFSTRDANYRRVGAYANRLGANDFERKLLQHASVANQHRGH